MKKARATVAVERRRRLAPLALLLVPLVAWTCRPEPVSRQEVPQRIIAVAPNIVEILYELGVGERVVGVGDYCTWPPQVEGKTRIGGLLDPRLEEIVRLEPDLAILLASEEALARALEDLGIEALVVPVETVEDVELAVAAIGRRIGAEAEAGTLIDRLRRGLEPRPDAAGGKVLLVVGREPGSLADIYAAATATFLDELLQRLGAENVLADSPVRYPRVSLEEILVRSPAVIVELQPRSLTEEVRERLVADWQAAGPSIAPCVSVIEGDHLLVPGPRLPQLYRDLASALAACGGERA